MWIASIIAPDFDRKFLLILFQSNIVTVILDSENSRISFKAYQKYVIRTIGVCIL